MKPLFEVTAAVDTTPEQLRALFDDGWVLRAVLGQHDHATAAPASMDGSPGAAVAGYVDIDQSPGMFGLQGHWWYRGEWSVEVSGGAVRIVNRVFNIARSHRWAVPLANKMFIGYRSSMQTGIDELARQINQRLRAV